MSLRNTLRKAAGLLVELPPDQEASTPHAASGASGGGGMTDQMWAELEKASQKPQTAQATQAAQTAVPFAAPPPSKTVEQIVRDEHGPNLDQIQVTSHAVHPDAHLSGTLDFKSIYQAANLPSSPFSAEQVLDMFGELPAELPLQTKRQMMQVSVNAMGKAIGASPESIVADASRKLAALAAYTDHLTQTTQEYTSLSTQKIAELEAEIDKIRQAVANAQQRQFRETQLCTEESHRLDDVLEFFSLDVPPSKYAETNPNGLTTA